MLAVDLKNFLADTETQNNENKLSPEVIWNLQERFRILKKQIVNFYTCTKNYKEKFVEELQQITEGIEHEKEK